MKNRSTLTSESLEDLILDINNPRFAELYSGSSKEEDLIEYLLYTEAAEDIAKAILQANEFYPDRPLWVLKNDDKYLVKDGNRRCAAVKALQFPSKYGLDLRKMNLKELPILIYENEKDLEKRILQEHTSSLFREWDRIAKALQVYSLYASGNSIDSMKEIDTQPPQLIKLASFYYDAVKIGGEALKKLLRRGRGKTGGKTIVFERLFKHRKLCGYNFKNKPSYQINITDKGKFSQYILAMVKYLEKHPETTHKTIDEKGKRFLNKLKEFGFEAKIVPTSKKPKGSADKAQKDKGKQGGSGPGSIKHKPNYERKQVPAALDNLIKECYNLDHNNFSNAKTALTRVSFECTLKYIVENTKYDPKKNISESNYLKKAFFDGKGNKLSFTNFEVLKTKFTELIKNTGKRKAFENFNLDNPHQIIHNYNVGALPNDAKSLCDNLIPLLEFMLQEEKDLLNSLDLTKL